MQYGRSAIEESNKLEIEAQSGKSFTMAEQRKEGLEKENERRKDHWMIDEDTLGCDARAQGYL